MGNEEDETIVSDQYEELAQSDTSDYESAGDATPREKSRKILYMILMILIV